MAAEENSLDRDVAIAAVADMTMNPTTRRMLACFLTNVVFFIIASFL
jgi:hypothetical protein